VLRLKDGQTEVIGGLIQDEDRSNIAGLPGVVELPILGRLFGKQTDTKNKKEIIMSITPRIVRNNRQVDGELLEMWSGTESNMRFGARNVGSPKLQAAASAAGQPTAAAVTAPAARQTSTPRTLVAAAPAQVAMLRPLTFVAPQGVMVGQMIGVTVSFPPMTAATSLETTINFDADRLRLINVTDADSTKNATQGIRFTAEADGKNAVQIELSAGRGETLLATGGPLANFQFEVLEPTGPTQLTVERARFNSVENGAQALPEAAPVVLEVKPRS
jgi:general secretion pathway protein D